MRKYILMITLFILSNSAFSQSEDNIIKYKAKGIYVVLQNNKGEQLTKIPFGKDVIINYDEFFKTFEILYENREGGIDAMKLLFLSEKEINGTKYFKMKDKYGSLFNVFGNLERIGTLIIIMDKKDEDGNISLITIDGAKKQE
ncbi:hypothetical protein [Polaribacter sp.]|uniref:hypothetical protein n=1 Tax=Polaribacter sp. TaxID=1920175 RepID=UPI004048BE94